MRTALSVVGVLLILVGAVWFLQGINVIGGSVMTGQSEWVIWGALAVAAGLGLLFYARRRKAM